MLDSITLTRWQAAQRPPDGANHRRSGLVVVPPRNRRKQASTPVPAASPSRPLTSAEVRELCTILRDGVRLGIARARRDAQQRRNRHA